MKIKLVTNGIFPITLDDNGFEYDLLPQTGYSFSGTYQGEGKLIGVPSLFIRTSGCNLRCIWSMDDGSVDICDTPYSSHHAIDFEEVEISTIINTIKQNIRRMKHIVITGGEPTIHPEIVELAKELKKLKLHITLETNGVHFNPELIKYIDLVSISPKLKSSIPTKDKIKKMDNPIPTSFSKEHDKLRINISTIQKYINACYIGNSYYNDIPEEKVRSTTKDFQLKFVIASKSDVDEIKNDFLSKLHNVNNDDICLMPIGGTKNFLDKSTKMTAELALENNWRFTPRLQVDLYGNLPGV